MADIGSREELAAMIEGKSDEEISAGVSELGTDKVLAQIFEHMAKDAFRPERAGNQSAVVGWDITSPEGTHSWQLKVADGTCTAVSGSAEPASTVAVKKFESPMKTATNRDAGRW